MDETLVKVVRMIHNLRIQIASEPHIIRDVDVQIINIPPKYGLLLSINWSSTLNGYWATDFKHLWLPWKGVTNHIKVLSEPYLLNPITEYNRANQVALTEEDLGIYCLALVDPTMKKEANSAAKALTSVKKKLATNECWTLRFDSLKSRMGGGVGVEFQSPKRKKYHASFRLEFPYTCNTTEYEALIQGIMMAFTKKAKNIKVIKDSQLVIRQVRDQYECKDLRLSHYRTRVWNLIEGFKAFNIRMVPRKHNIMADSLVVVASTFQPIPGTKLKKFEI